MAYPDLRAFLTRLEAEGELVRFPEELSPVHEVSALFQQLSRMDAPAVLLERVRGYAVPVVGNLLGTRRRLALALETTEADIVAEYQRRRHTPIPPKVIPQAPAQAVVQRGAAVDILKTIPVLTYYERDAGPFITQGVVFLKDPATGARTMGIHRLQVKGKDKLGVWFSGGTALRFLQNAEARQQPLDCAVAIGLEPVMLLAAVAFMPGGGDKLALAGGLRGEAVELARAATVDLDVPAHAMFLIEGRIPPGVREPEGPMGDSGGYYIAGNNPVIQVTALSHQRQPIYSFFLPYSQEEMQAMLLYEGELVAALKMALPNLRDAAMLPGRLGLVVAIKKENAEDGKKVLEAVLKANPNMKYALVVDEDVNIRDPQELAWALFGRCQPDGAVLVIKDTPGSVIDPSLRPGGLSSKLGLDATRPLERPERFDRIGVPSAVSARAREVVKAHFPLLKLAMS